MQEFIILQRHSDALPSGSSRWGFVGDRIYADSGREAFVSSVLAESVIPSQVDVCERLG